MPAYPLTFPTVNFPLEVKVEKVWAQARFDNPLQLSSQVQLRSARRYEIDVTLQPMPADDAAAFTQFFEDLQGGFGTFTFDMTPHCPGLTVPAGVRTFRLATAKHGWSSKLAVEFGFTFTAIEAL